MVRPAELFFFSLTERLAQISQERDPLERLKAIIDWEILQPVLDRIFPAVAPKGLGRRFIATSPCFGRAFRIRHAQTTGGGLFVRIAFAIALASSTVRSITTGVISLWNTLADFFQLTPRHELAKNGLSSKAC